MSRVLFTWECGGGYGHLTRYQRLITTLQEHGHEVCFAVRNIQSGQKIYPGKNISILPAPLPSKSGASRNRVAQPESYLDVLINQCFDHPELLKSRIRVWLSMYQVFKPQLIVFDHSPTALMAKKLFPDTKSLTCGTGFSVPPIQGGLLPFSSGSKLTPEHLRKKDNLLLDKFLNPSLTSLGGAELASCMDIFDQSPLVFGIPELDHYSHAKRSDLFIGEQKNSGYGTKPEWPKSEGPKVFLYSENHQNLPAMLDKLSKLGWPTIAVFKNSAKQMIGRFQSDSMRCSEELVDIKAAAKECDFAITNASMATCLNFVRAGKPMLLLPAHIEQSMFSNGLANRGCAINPVAASQSVGDALAQFGDPENDVYDQARALASEIRSSLEMDADETLLQSVLQNLN